MNISCKLENPPYNTLGSRGVTGKSLHIVAVVAPAYRCIIHSIHRIVVGKSFGFVGIDTECKKNSTSANIGKISMSKSRIPKMSLF